MARAAKSQFPPKKKPVRAAVLAGGIGAEREVSLESGRCVAKGLREAGYDVLEADITPDDMRVLEDKSVDVFFIALHGEFGEDGQLQRELEKRSLVYTGSGPAASELAFDKIASKKAFTAAGVSVPAEVKFSVGDDKAALAEKLSVMADKYIVKPVRQGSSVGISITDDIDEAIAMAQRTTGQFGDCMIEEFIAGREITVGILCGEALPIIEIKPRSQFYDYHAKYVDEGTEFLFDTISDASLRRDIQAKAMDCFEALGCRGFGRVDFILDDNGKLYALEVNTIPGFTSHSLLPQAAAKAGIDMAGLCGAIVEAAFKVKATSACRGAGI